MSLNLIKLCVGVSDLDELQNWVKECQQRREIIDHVTRMFPKRAAEILPGGSLYWVIRGMVLCRQPIVGLEPVTGSDGIERCRIIFKPQIVPVRPTPKRAFQGWRYLEAESSPPDLPRASAAVGMPEKLRRELAELGLL